MPSNVLKTGLLAPPFSLAHERSQIMARVEDDLNVFRVAQEQKRARRFRNMKLRFLSCGPCKEHGLNLTMREFMLEKHLLNHRIHRALGSEGQWIDEMKATRAANTRRFQTIGAQASITARKKAALWIWQRTILKMKDRQKLRLAWSHIRIASPIWILPASSWRWGHQIEEPHHWAHAYKVCADIGGNLATSNFYLIFSGWMRPEEQKRVRERFSIAFIADKQVVHGVSDPLQFVVWSKR